MATVRDVISDALTELGILAAGETPPDIDSTAGLNALNRLVDQWAAERLQIYTETRTVFTITSGTQNYNVGPSQTVNVARPVFPDHVNFQDTSVSPILEYQLQPLTEDAYAKIPQKALTSPFPNAWYYNPTFPSAVLTLWPKPTATTLQGVLYAPQAVAEFAGLDDAISLPPGYRRMLVKNLAVELGPSYTRQLDPVVLMQAKEAKEVVKRANKRLMDLSVDAAALVQGHSRTFGYNINTGP